MVRSGGESSIDSRGCSSDCANIARRPAGMVFVAEKTIKSTVMAKYGKKAGEKVERAMHEMHEGKLKSGNSDKKVTSKKQAIAIGLSEARKEGGKVPKKSSSSKGSSRSHSSSPKSSSSSHSSSHHSSKK